MEGLQVCIITGGNSGIGFETAKKLLSLDYHVILGCRNKERAEKAVEELRPFIKGPSKIEYLLLDLENFDSVKDFSSKFLAMKLPLHALVLNAGVMLHTRCETPYGPENTLITNHVGHFLLTYLLIKVIKASVPSRIVVISSELHERKKKPFDWDNLDGSKGYDGMLFYSNSKLVNIWFMKVLADKLKDSGIKVNAVTPGWIPETNLKRDASFMTKFMMDYVFKWLPFTKSLEHGVKSYMIVIHEPLSVTGKYFCNLKEKEPSKEAQDMEQATRMWDYTCDLLKLDKNFLEHE